LLGILDKKVDANEEKKFEKNYVTRPLVNLLRSCDPKTKKIVDFLGGIMKFCFFGICT
jgi:hypothetical protein